MLESENRGVDRELRIMLYLYDNQIIITSQWLMLRVRPLALEERTARLTILIDPRKKAIFERLCAEEDATPSQVVRRLLREYIEKRTGRRWTPDEAARTEGHAKGRMARRG